MAKLRKLQACSPLGNYSRSYGKIVLQSVTGKAAVSVAVPLDQEDALNKFLKSKLKLSWPKITKTVSSEDNSFMLLGLQSDMAFALFDRVSDETVSEFICRFEGGAYCTDQSDAWTIISLKGEGSIPALERICPLDLSLNAMPVGSVMRTMMEHLGVIIMRQDVESFLLMSASSSVKSFVHAVELSIQNSHSLGRD